MRNAFGTLFELVLPRTRATWNEEGRGVSLPSRVPLLVLGGRAPDPEWLGRMACGREVWALDRGTDACRAAGVLPSRVLGDFDSISNESREWVEERGVAVDRYNPDKDDTDFQLALKLLVGDALVTGCWGGRFDHAFSNVFSSLAARERGVRVLCFADEREVLFPLRGLSTLELEFWASPSALSLLPLTAACKGVFVENAKWPLEDAVLLQSSPCAVSNVPLGDKVRVSVREGVLGVYGVWGETPAS